MKYRSVLLRLLAATGAALVLGATATANPTPSHDGLVPTDKKFLMDAAQGGMAEVRLGQLALKNGSSREVKQFGALMVADHGKTNLELKQLAKKKSIKLPATVGPNHQAHLQRLATLKGAAFDKAYISHMVRDHEMDVKAFQKASNLAQDHDLRDWAGQTLPTLEEHLRMVKELAGPSRASGGDGVSRRMMNH